MRTLVALDYRDLAEAAWRHAESWTPEAGGEVTVLNVVDESLGPQAVWTATGELDRWLRDMAAPGSPRVHAMVKAGSPAGTVCAVADEMDADLIVLGGHGRSVVGRWVLGSVTADVLAHTTRPVLIVRTPPAASTGVVIASVDFSEVSTATVRAAGRVAADRGARLVLLHVLPIGEHPSAGHEVMRDTARQALEKLRPEVPADVDMRADVELRAEGVASAISEHADRENADCIVIGGHGESGWVKGVLGSVTTHLLHETARPVLVVRGDRPA